MQRFNGVEHNPVIGLELIREAPRDRYVSDDEYAFIHVLVSPTLKLMIEGTYLLRARRSELTKLDRVRNLSEKGVLIERSKDS